MSDNLSLEIKTVQSAAFRVLTEALKEILTDANFEIDETGIKIIAMDSSHTVLVNLKLNAERKSFLVQTAVCLPNKAIGKLESQASIKAPFNLVFLNCSLLETEKIQSLFHLLENKDNCTAKGIGDWLRKF